MPFWAPVPNTDALNRFLYGSSSVPIHTPGLSNGIVLNAGGATWTFGSWTQISAALAGPSILEALSRDNMVAGNNNNKLVQIGIGAAGFEAAIAEWKWEDPNTSIFDEMPCIPWEVIPNNARVSGRVATYFASGNTEVSIKTRPAPI